MFPLGRMVFPRAPPSGKPSSLGETFHHVTPTGMAYLYIGLTLSMLRLLSYKAQGSMIYENHLNPVMLVFIG